MRNFYDEDEEYEIEDRELSDFDSLRYEDEHQRRRRENGFEGGR